MTGDALQRLCRCVGALNVSAPLRVLKLGPAADETLGDDFVAGHLLPMLQVGWLTPCSCWDICSHAQSGMREHDVKFVNKQTASPPLCLVLFEH